MNLKRQGRNLFFDGYEASGGLKHPMIIHGCGVTTVVAACTTGLGALAVSAIMLTLCLLMGVIYIYERGEYLQPMRSMLYFVPSALTACLCGLLLNYAAPGTAGRLGMYLPLMAADSLVLAGLRPDAPFIRPSDALPEAFRLWWLYAVTAVPVGVLREILSEGRIFGLPLFFRPDIAAAKLPFAGFIMLGFGLAIYEKRHRADT